MRQIGLTLLLGCFLTSPVQASDVEKKGYIITSQGDTVHGTILLRKELGAISNIQLFSQVRFSDSTGVQKTFKPGDLKGYGLAFINDTTLSHFVTFHDVEMQGAFGSKRETALLLREVDGYVEVYHLLHSINTGYYRTEVPEIYLRKTNEANALIRIKPKTFKVPMRFKRSDILPHLKDWPEAEFSKIHEELSPMEVMICVATYNEWRKTNIMNNQ
jgi:hypothetical protein